MKPLIIYEQVLFSLVTVRTKRECWACSLGILPGEQAYRPLIEKGRVKRYLRLCNGCGNIQPELK